MRKSSAELLLSTMPEPGLAVSSGGTVGLLAAFVDLDDLVVITGTLDKFSGLGVTAGVIAGTLDKFSGLGVTAGVTDVLGICGGNAGK